MAIWFRVGDEVLLLPHSARVCCRIQEANSEALRREAPGGFEPPYEALQASA
jgi:hypothetical protein